MDLRELIQVGLQEKRTSHRIEEGLGDEDSFVQSKSTFVDVNGVPVTVGTSVLHRLE